MVKSLTRERFGGVKMEGKKKIHSMHIKAGQLWPSTIYVGNTVIKFLVGPRGRSIKVTGHGSKPRHVKLAKKARRRYNDRRG